MIHNMGKLVWPFLCLIFTYITAVSAQCVIDNITLEHGQSHVDCNQNCTCDYGRIACVSRCPPAFNFPTDDCPNPQKQKVQNECCEINVCKDCPLGRWGVACVKKCGQCASEGKRCNITTGECPLSDKSPRCYPGYFGNSCTESCVQGTYGRGCTLNCGKCAGGQCNVTTGTCLQKNPSCLPGWRGLLCDQKCQKGWYGPDCLEKCGECAAGNCKRTTGDCFLDVPLCKAGYAGDLCKAACKPGTFGPECQWSCGGCFKGRTTCKPQNGECPVYSPRCMPGYMESNCKACPQGKWGEDCVNNCSVNCARGILECDRRDGTCIGGCISGYLDDLCESQQSTSPDLGTVIGLAVGLGVLILVVTCACILFYLYRHRHTVSKSPLQRETSYLTPTHAVPMTSIVTDQAYEVPITMTDQPDDTYLPPCPSIPQVRPEVYSFYETILPLSDWNVDIKDLDIKNQTMIQGSFGKTQLAYWKCSPDSQVQIAVSLKKFLGNGSDEKKNLINRQLDKLRSLERCMNVLTVLGSSLDADTGNLYLILEWTDEGNLNDYLRYLKTNGQPETKPNDDLLLKFCLDVSLAMVHLSLNKISSVDLSGKTIMLDKHLDAKVTGFVKFDDKSEKVMNKQADESWRWCSFEALAYDNHCSANDVWSFGVLMWEVFSLGDTPYSEFMTDKELKSQLEAGCRLGHPSRAPIAAFVLMTECWQQDSLLRPYFADIVNRLQAISSTDPFYPDRKSGVYSEPI